MNLTKEIASNPFLNARIAKRLLKFLFNYGIYDNFILRCSLGGEDKDYTLKTTTRSKDIIFAAFKNVPVNTVDYMGMTECTRNLRLKGYDDGWLEITSLWYKFLTE